MGTYKCCFCFRRRYRWTDAPPPDDVRSLFAHHSGGAATMGADGLRRYLESKGTGAEDDNSEAAADRLLDQIRHGQRGARIPRVGRPLIALEEFHRFLFSDDLNPPIRRPQVHHDMTAPLSHYFIYTGHNSYLTGNQLSSDCSDIPIIKALQKGVRVIELDMWPNSTRDDINILHGRTLTTPVSLLKCLRSIKEYAFVVSSYPVIITLEDHLPPDLQDKVAKMVLEVFASILYYPDTEHIKELPSPEDLKGRVLLSTKPPKEYLEAKAGGTIKDGDADPNLGKGAGEDAAWGKEVPDFKTEIQSAKEDDVSEHHRDDDDEDDDDDEEEQKMQQHLAPQYKHLITIKAGKPKGTTADALRCDPDRVRRLSLSEQELAKAVVHHGTEIVRFTQRNLLRIYPKGTRVTSSNYNPFLGWVHGAQMVAFNMQGYGRALWLMHGFYKANGGCGYVKKPDFLMQSDVFDPKKRQPVKKTLKVKIYMGDGWRMDFKHTHFDQYSPPDFYARVGIAGVPADSVMKKTRTIEDNWVPVWEEEFAFDLTVPEIALLRVEVHEYDMSEKDDFGGQTVLPVSELQPGIRAVALFDRKGNKFNNVKLLMRFEFV
ncbi:phosphoinositide phospholipase C 2 isoform X2 [Brachypodium distachyon]|uniref:phosphoinositide phospholipase C 2 isoform X2 n=1 Tax=Brachypodium distachyon TaxID=15368 RepID=UPI0001C7515C|nr:phosphoinositide phospholipase C 2 isoform X2 [Brachypodium distachyon]|eukprot:XP_003562396.1 phosphoinositide phospholipase C 2 isoform X2 [Brachypodium distachyon]